MRTLGKYFKSRWAWFVVILGIEAVMTALLIFNNVPVQEIIYGGAISFFLVVMFGIVDAMHWCRRYNQLRKLEDRKIISRKEFPDAGDVMEVEYQCLLEKLMQEDIDRQNEGLRRQRGMQEYYGMWVHQIKTPISALRLLLQGKNDEGKNDEELEELFRIEQYVEMALHYLRIDSESADLVLAYVKIDDVVRGAVRKYARQFVHKKISLDYETSDVEVLTDEKWLAFVVEQILSNAIKYTPGGKISIRVESLATESEIKCNGGIVEREQLIIEDTGIGIRAEDLPRICEKGYTGYNGRADKSSTGIGLYLCQRVLKKLGHGLSITSEEGVGTRVAITFEKEANLTKL